MTTERRGIYLTTDLFFSSRITSLARDQGYALQVAGSEPALLEELKNGGVALVIVDLANFEGDVHSLVRGIREQPTAPFVLAYGPHVDEVALDGAHKAGCDDVLSRGQFNQHAAEILARYLSSSNE